MEYRKQFKNMQKAFEALAIKDVIKFTEKFGIKEDFFTQEWLFDISVKEILGKKDDEFFKCEVVINLTEANYGE